MWDPRPGAEQVFYAGVLRTVNPTGESPLNQTAIAGLLKRSKLDQEVLRQVWNVALDGSKAIGVKEFNTLLRGVSVAQSLRIKNISKELILSTAAEELPHPVFEGFEIVPEKVEKTDETPGLDDNLWAILAGQRTQYDEVFAKQTIVEGKLAGPAAVGLFQQSGLSTTDLRNIWNLADVDMDGKLSEAEFAIAMHLIMCVKRRSWTVPTKLPVVLRALIPPTLFSVKSNSSMGSARTMDESDRTIVCSDQQATLMASNEKLDSDIAAAHQTNGAIGASTAATAAIVERLNVENESKTEFLRQLQQEQGRLLTVLAELTVHMNQAEGANEKISSDIRETYQSTSALQFQVEGIANRLAQVTMSLAGKVTESLESQQALNEEMSVAVNHVPNEGIQSPSSGSAAPIHIDERRKSNSSPPARAPPPVKVNADAPNRRPPAIAVVHPPVPTVESIEIKQPVKQEAEEGFERAFGDSSTGEEIVAVAVTQPVQSENNLDFDSAFAEASTPMTPQTSI